jgi:16S rRNA (uracil1498-N3)-methyltransferase
VRPPLFLVPAGSLEAARIGSPLRLDGEEGRHAATVRRIRAGERVDVADGFGLLARCRVTATGRDRLELVVEGVEAEPPPRPRIVLVQALATGGRDELAVATATEVGVDGVIPWQAGRSVARWPAERAERARHRWEVTAAEAAKQSRRGRLPVIEKPLSTAELAVRAATAFLLIVLDEAAEVPLARLSLPTGDGVPDGEVLLVVGPEGGIDREELEILSAAGAVTARLGGQVLRSSTAGPVAVAVLAVRLGRPGWS